MRTLINAARNKRGFLTMKKGTLKILTLCCIFAALSLTACNSSDTGTAADSSTPTESSVVSAESSKTNTTNDTPESSSIDENSAEASVEENTGIEVEESSEESTDTSQNGSPYTSDDEQIEQSSHQQASYTDNTDFNTLFAQNALDTSYQTAVADATESQMASIAAQYTGYWQAEVENAYAALALATGENYDEEKESWQSNAQLQTQEIYNAAKSEGGSMAVLAAYTEVMNLYKSKAAQLYEQVYTLTGSFSLAYAE